MHSLKPYQLKFKWFQQFVTVEKLLQFSRDEKINRLNKEMFKIVFVLKFPFWEPYIKYQHEYKLKYVHVLHIKTLTTIK